VHNGVSKPDFEPIATASKASRPLQRI